MTRRTATLAALLILAATGLLVGSPSTWARAAAVPASARPQGSPIKHVVLIYQENHTFDSVLGAVCQTRVNPCNGYTGPVTFADGKTARNIVEPDVVPDIQHDPDSQSLALSDQWNKIPGCREKPHECISHVAPRNIPNIAALADTFAVSDTTFAVGRSASFGAHITLVAGTTDGFVGFNPKHSLDGTPSGIGWGCPSDRDALWESSSVLSYQPTCIPDMAGDGPYRGSQVPYVPTIMQRMEQAGRTWHIYEGPSPENDYNNVWSVCTYFYWCYHNRSDSAHHGTMLDFEIAAHQGMLANLTLLIPTAQVSQHNLASMAIGDNYIGTMVSAIEQGPEWDSTAVFITYDDCGCFYDHVVPPPGLGLRNPVIIVSPWVKPAYTDSVEAVQPYSMLAFVQHTFGLRSITTDVDNAYDYEDSFNFGQRPLKPVGMTTTPVSATKRERIDRVLATIKDDPT